MSRLDYRETEEGVLGRPSKEILKAVISVLVAEINDLRTLHELLPLSRSDVIQKIKSRLRSG